MSMTARVLGIAAVAITVMACQQQATTEESAAADAGGPMVVEAACGLCQFGLPGAGCELAVRIDGTGYYVEGVGIDEHGDAHAEDGFCNTVRRARVAGHLEGDRFVVTSFELLPAGSS